MLFLHEPTSGDRELETLGLPGEVPGRKEEDRRL